MKSTNKNKIPPPFSNPKGKVYLVGAGPGRPDLITLRAAQLIKTADCIIYDKLVNPLLLKFARQDAELIPVPKRIGPGSFNQEQINKLLIERACAGETVVRLKGGDPGIFGRAAQEAAILDQVGIDFEIVPGVTAAIAAADYTGIMLTDRRCSSQVVFVTGQEAQKKQKTNIDWHWLAKFNGTIVFYMAVSNLNFITNQLIKNGMSKQTPAAVITDVTLPTQRTVKATLGQISQKCSRESIAPPAIVIIGAVAKSNVNLNWFAKKPLFGKNILITRDIYGNADFAAKIIQQGANPIEFPTIKIKPLTNTNKFIKTLAKFSQYHWIIFTSPNGVVIFFDALQRLNRDARVFASSKIAVIGSQTAAKLAQFGLKADFVPTTFTSEQLAKGLINFTSLAGKKILLLRSKIANANLAHRLIQAKANVDDVPVYTIIMKRNKSDWLIERISQGMIDWLTFASSSAVDSFFQQIPADLVNSSKVKIASIGPVTSKQLKNLGLKVHAEATIHTLDGLLTAIEKSKKPKAKSQPKQ